MSAAVQASANSKHESCDKVHCHFGLRGAEMALNNGFQVSSDIAFHGVSRHAKTLSFTSLCRTRQDCRGLVFVVEASGHREAV